MHPLILVLSGIDADVCIILLLSEPIMFNFCCLYAAVGYIVFYLSSEGDVLPISFLWFTYR